MATLNLEPAISTRYRIERVMYRGRCSIETGSHTALQPIPRARIRMKPKSAWSLATLADKEHVGVSAPQQGVSRFLSSIGS